MREYFKNGFRFNHLFVRETSSGKSTISYLKYALECGKRDILKNGVFTADMNCLKENINGKVNY